MARPELTVTRVERGASVVVQVAGDVDLATTHLLAEALREPASSGGRVVVDLHECPFVDSSGLRALLDAHRAAGGAGGSLVVARADANVKRVLEVAALDGVLGTYETVEDALA